MENKLEKFHRKSNLYDNIFYVVNSNQQFNFNQSISQHFKVFSPKQSQVHLYFSATARIFQQLKTLNNKHVWVCYKQFTKFPIRVYFTQPQQFPVADCCMQVVYVQFLSDLSGSIKCSKCHKSAFQFVKVSKNRQQQHFNELIVKKKPTKKPIKNQSRLSELDTSQLKHQSEAQQNRQLFHNIFDNLEQKKAQVSRLISSRKYRQRPLKRIFTGNKTTANTENLQQKQFIIQTTLQQKEQINIPTKYSELFTTINNLNTSPYQNPAKQELFDIISEIFI